MGLELRQLYQGDRVNPGTRIRAVSLGHALDADVPGRGVVHSVFRGAVNLMLGADLWTVLTEDRTDLPLGIRLPLTSLDGLGLRRCDPVHVRAGYLGIGSRVVVDCRATRRWTPVRANEVRPGLVRRIEVVAAATRGRSWHASSAMAQELMSAAHDANLLQAVLAGVVGRGPGATPSGDDVLVGVFAVLKSPHFGSAGDRTAELFGRLLLPLLPRTTEVSGHLLRQASNGWFSRDLDELADGLIGSASADELSKRARRVIDTGATSGADACEGLLAFAPSFFRTQREGAF